MQSTQLSASEHQNPSRLQVIYLLLTVAGTVLPWAFLLGYLQQDQISIHTFLTQALGNDVSIAFVADLVISAEVFSCFIFAELRRLEIPRIWLAVYGVLMLTVGPSCALPLFLYVREGALQTKGHKNTQR